MNAEQKTTNTIVINAPDGAAPLYERYASQTNAQPANVVLYCDTAELTAFAAGEIGGGVPADVYHRRVLRWHVCNELTGPAVAELLAEVAPLAQRVVDGYSVEWDGNNNVGRYTEDASEAAEEIEALCAEAVERLALETVAVWRANEWLADYRFDDYHWPDGATWESAAQMLTEQAAVDKIVLDGDVAAAVRYRAMEAAEDGLNLPAAAWRALGETLAVSGHETDDECDEIAGNSGDEGVTCMAVRAVRDALAERQ